MIKIKFSYDQNNKENDIDKLKKHLINLGYKADAYTIAHGVVTFWETE